MLLTPVASASQSIARFDLPEADLVIRPTWFAAAILDPRLKEEGVDK